MQFDRLGSYPGFVGAPELLTMFTIFRRTESGELTAVATTDNRTQAERLMNSLNKLWPAEYVIEEARPDSKSGAGEP